MKTDIERPCDGAFQTSSPYTGRRWATLVFVHALHVEYLLIHDDGVWTPRWRHLRTACTQLNSMSNTTVATLLPTLLCVFFLAFFFPHFLCRFILAVCAIARTQIFAACSEDILIFAYPLLATSSFLLFHHLQRKVWHTLNVSH